MEENNNISLRERLRTSSVVKHPEVSKQDNEVEIAKRLFKELEDKHQNKLAYARAVTLINQQREKGKKWKEIVVIINQAYELGLDLSGAEKLKSQAFVMAKQVGNYNKKKSKHKQ